MNISPIIFFEMTIAIVVLAAALIVIIIYLSKITQNLHPIKDEALQKDVDLLDETRKKVIKIVDEANNQALDIVSKATLLNEDTSCNFKENLNHVSGLQIKEFEKTTSTFSELYSQILKDLKTKNIEIFQNISKDIETNTMKEIKDFKESMQKLTFLSQKEARDKIDAEYKSTIKEVENYKKEEIEKINAEIYQLLEKISKLVLGKALSLSEHEELIEKSLEKAKKEGIFKS